MNFKFPRAKVKRQKVHRPTKHFNEILLKVTDLRSHKKFLKEKNSSWWFNLAPTSFTYFILSRLTKFQFQNSCMTVLMDCWWSDKCIDIEILMITLIEGENWNLIKNCAWEILRNCFLIKLTNLIGTWWNLKCF